MSLAIISWLGFACFKIQTKTEREQFTIVTDPYDSKTGLRLPRSLKADILTVSRDHFAHNNVNAVSPALPGSSASTQTKAATEGALFVINTPGEYEIKDIFVYGIQSPSAKEEKSHHPEINTVFRFEIGNISLAHLGGVNTILNEEQLEQLKDVDVLMIPVGGGETIDAKTAHQIVQQIEPRLIIPMYFDLALPKLSYKLDKVDNFLSELGVGKIEPLPKIKINKADLPEGVKKVVLLEKS